MATRTINVTPETSGFADVALSGQAADVAFDPIDYDGTSATVQAALEAAWASLVALGAAIGGPYQSASATLDLLAALSTTTYGRSLLTQADATAARTTLGLGTVATTDASAYQPVDSDLTAIAALSTTTYGRALLALADAAAARTALGLGTAATTAATAYQPAYRAINAQTASYTAVLADHGRVVEITSATAVNFTIPPNSSVAFPTGSLLTVRQTGAGLITPVAGAGVTIRGLTASTAQWQELSFEKRATDEWVQAV